MENKNRLISIFAVLILTLAATTVYGAVKTLGPGSAAIGPNILPTFEKGFSAGLRPAPTQCFTEVNAEDLKSKDFNRKVREICEQKNQRKGFCVDYCVNKAVKANKALRKVTLTDVPKADCLKPINKVYSSPDECTRERMRHCSVNCEKGRDQNTCSHTALVYCRRQGAHPFKPYTNF